jgi:hypothetical protein
MAASLLRRARTTHVSSGAVRAWASSGFRHREPLLLVDRAELQVAYYDGGARYSSSSAVSGFREASLSRFITTCTASQVSLQLLWKESIGFFRPHSVRGLASQSAPQLRQQVQEEVRSQHFEVFMFSFLNTGMAIWLASVKTV